jgi:hypothetical protein
MDLNKKIEEIRQKPENIRLRYVWGAVVVSMIFIIIIWIFSLGESIKEMKSTDSNNLPDIKQSLEEMQSIKDSVPSINDMVNNSQTNKGQNSPNNQSLGNEGIQNQAPTENNPVNNTNQ